jgi:hypothetical protein
MNFSVFVQVGSYSGSGVCINAARADRLADPAKA